MCKAKKVWFDNLASLRLPEPEWSTISMDLNLRNDNKQIWLKASMETWLKTGRLRVPLRLEAISPEQTTTVLLACRETMCGWTFTKDRKHTLMGRIRRSEDGVDVRINVGPMELGGVQANNFYRLRGKWNRRLVGIEVFKQLHGRTRQDDFLLKAKLEGSHLLKTTAVLKPGITEDIRVSFCAQVTTFAPFSLAHGSGNFYPISQWEENSQATVVHMILPNNCLPFNIC